MKLNKTMAAAWLLACGTLYAQDVEVSGAWVRATVAGQSGTGAFMSLSAKDGARLVGVSSPVAGVAEVHEMKMDGDVMKMRALPVLDLPAGRAVQFRPGGYHIMLMDLKQPLPRGATVPLTLRLQDAKGRERRLELSVPVGTAAPSAPAGGGPQRADGQAGPHGAHAR